MAVHCHQSAAPQTIVKFRSGQNQPEEVIICQHNGNWNGTFSQNTSYSRKNRATTTDSSCRLALASHLQAFSFDAVDKKLHSGSIVEEFLLISFQCNAGYTLSGSKQGMCIKGKIIYDSRPYCQKLCSSKMLECPSIQVTCDRNSEKVSCASPMRRGTMATVTCSEGYIRANDVMTDIQTYTCLENGKWNDTIRTCSQICGIRPDSNNSVKTTVPWHVSIHSDTYERFNFRPVCSGTIITAKFVLSAAHCFWDYLTNSVSNVERLKVNHLASTSDLMIIQTILLHSAYTGVHDYYRFDIAMVKTMNPIEFNLNVAPICLLPFRTYDLVGTRILGQATSLNYDTDNRNTMRIVEMSTVPVSECKENSTISFREYITSDRFCVNSLNNSDICVGDGGGGFSIGRNINGTEVHFLHGILSTAPGIHGNCYKNYLTVTDLSRFLQFIRNAVNL